MTRDHEPGLVSALELLLRCRSERFRDDISTRYGHAERPGARTERVALLNECSESMERDCRHTLDRVLTLLQAFEAAPTADAIGNALHAYVDGAAAQLVDVLGAGSGSPATPAEQRQIANLAARIKTLTSTNVARAVQEAARERERDELSTADSPAELDDRLPLRRRRTFDRDLVEMVAAARRDGESASLVMIDIDHFKRVNDEHGHPAGDEVLLEMAARTVLRVAHKGRAYRFGGEELALLLPRYSAEEAAGLAERLRKDVAATPFGRNALAITASFGVACVPDHASDAQGLLARADAALYAAKHGGRNTVRTAE